MSGLSASKIMTRLGIPLALAVAILWSVKRFVSADLATKLLMVLLLFLGVLIGVWLVVWILRSVSGLFSAARARRQAAAAQEPDVPPQQRSELDSLRESLNQALQVMAQSKLAKGKGKSEALYALPWILLLGESESGKTEALRQSGLEFAYSTADQRRSRRGAAAGGCDYWFTRHAVVLDLSGRIATDDEETEVFKGFLDQLAHARSERPIDGVVMTVSMRSILDQSPEQLDLLATRLRQRGDEMVRRLGIRFPIYVLFTRCDEIDGFLDFFGSFRSRDRSQVWGATVSRDQRRQMPVEKIFEAEFSLLASALTAFRLQLMEIERDSSKLPKIFGFPARFAALRKKLEAFLVTLLQPTPYSERPMFRGFYFAGARAGAHKEQVEERQPVFDQKWDPDHRLGAPRERETARNYFLEMLFPRVIFSDRPLVKASVGTRLRRRLWLDVAFFATLVLCAVLLVGMIYSFNENRRLIASTGSIVLRVTDAGWNPKGVSDLMALEQLRRRVDELDRYRSGSPPWTMRWGLYSAGSLAESSRRVYLRRLHDSFVSPAANALRQRIYAFSSGAETPPSYSEFYSDLKAYLMMVQPSRGESSFLYNALAPFWKKLVTPEVEAVALDQLRFYSEQLPRNDPELQVTPDSGTIALARRALSQYPAIERIFTRLRDEGNRKFQSFTLAQATGGQGLQYLTSNHDVPGVFTEAGWSGYYKDAVGQASQQAAQDDWVLGTGSSALPTAQATGTDYQRLLLDKYFAEYIDEWRAFLEGTSIRPMADLTEARAALDLFSRQDSPLSRLLLNVAANTMLRKEPSKGTNIGTLFSSALATLGLTTRVDRSELIDPIADQFQPLHDIVSSPDGGKTPSYLAQYIAGLAKVQVRLESLFGAGTQWDQVKAYVDSIANNLGSNEFQDANRLVALINRQCTTRSTQPIGPMLAEPLRRAWSAILADAGYQLDKLWKAQISDGFKRELENGFPFNPSGRDIPLATLSQFFRPHDGTIDVFYEKELKMFLSQAGDAYAPRELIGAQVSFSPAFLGFMAKMNAVRQAFFPPGSPDITVSFDLTPVSAAGITDRVLGIDGRQFRYRNELEAPVAVTWPLRPGPPAASLTISLQGSGERPGIPAIEGEWAFFRLLNQARISAESQTTYMVVWSVPSSDGRRYEVPYRLQARNIRNPFAPGFFRGVVCPERITQLSVNTSQYGDTR